MHLIRCDSNAVASVQATVEQAAHDLAAGKADTARIVDDLGVGFRPHPGGRWEALGIRPHLSAFSKTIANGYPVAAVTGNERFRKAASNTLVTGSFRCEAPPMAVPIATQQALREGPVVIAHLVAMGQRLRDGLDRLSRQADIGIRQTGPVQMPMLHFDDDADGIKGRTFRAAALRADTDFHPRHNMFLSVAHQPADIDHALAPAVVGFEVAAAADAVR